MASTHHPITYPVRRVPLTRPFVWLADGWRDLLHHRAASIAYGLLVTALGTLILAYSRHPFYLAAVWVGFLLFGTLLTAGLCELSRRQDEGEPVGFEDSLRPLSHHRAALLGVAETLAVLAAIWFLLCGAVYFYVDGASVAPSLASTVWGDVTRHLSQGQLMAYGLTGLLLCAMVFALSVVTVPMIVDRHVDARTAMRTSVRATLRDLPAMLVWAALIVALVALGLATYLFALIFIFPLLGHATWRAYRELVPQ